MFRSWLVTVTVTLPVIVAIAIAIPACSAEPRAESDEPAFAPSTITLANGRALDNVRASVALDGGRLLVSRSTDVGESDLWIVPRDRKRPRALAAAHGADEMPFVLSDGRIVFVSTRTGVASLWIVNQDGTGLRQLTNVGVRASDPRFVPPPVAYLEQRGARVFYDDGTLTRSIDVNVGGGA